VSESHIHLAQSSANHEPQIIIEEMACAIANAQAALLAGRYADLEKCAIRLQELCAVFKTCDENIDAESARQTRVSDLRTTARRVHQENKIFAAVLRRTRRHFEILRNLLNGPPLTYRPQVVTMPERKR